MRHDELRERARKLLVQVRKDSTTTQNKVFFVFWFSFILFLFYKQYLPNFLGIMTILKAYSTICR